MLVSFLTLCSARRDVIAMKSAQFAVECVEKQLNGETAGLNVNTRIRWWLA